MSVPNNDASTNDTMTREEAVAAIQADVDSQSDPDQVVDASTPVNTPPDPTPTEDAPPDEDAWNIDVNSLPDDLKPFARSLQGDYTRKTQQIAELRKQYDEFGDPDSVAQAVALARAFQSDPVGTLRNVEDGLKEMGLLEQATPQPTPSATPPDDDDPVLAKLAQEYGADEPLFQLVKDMHSSLKEIKSEHKTWEEKQREQEQARLEREQEEYFARSETSLRQTHDSWDDEDFDAVYDLVLSTGGDMDEAAKRYQSITDRAITRYLQRKGALPTGTGGLPGTGLGTQPIESAKNFKEATERAKADLEALAAAGDFDLAGLRGD